VRLDSEEPLASIEPGMAGAGTRTLLEERGLELRAARRAVDRDRRRHRDGGVVALVQVERVALGLEERAILKAACRCEKLWVERQLAANDAGEEQQQRQEHREDRLWMTGMDHPARATLSVAKWRWNEAPRYRGKSI
jgi:hypothetical protein